MKNNFVSLQGKTILVTGASDGIGRASAALFAQLGAKVILVARNEEKLKEVYRSLVGTSHVIAPFDLKNLEEIPVFLTRLAGEHGLLHGLLHAAGIHLVRPLKLITPQNLEDIFKVNVSAAIMLAKGFRQKTVSQRPASLVFISSVVALVGQAAISPYAMTKGAIMAAAKSLAIELAPEQIRVNSILPGVVMTAMTESLFAKMGEEQVMAIKKMHPLGFGEPIDVANMVAFLLSDAARWITGTDMMVDGGYTAI